MTPSPRRGHLRSVIAFTLAVLMLLPNVALAQTDTSPWITSDKDDYAPGELVTLTGGNWQPGETVNIDVDDDQTKTWRRNVDVVADADGRIVDAFNLPNWFVATYEVVATGAVSGTVTHGFTDGNLRFLTTNNATNFEATWTKHTSSACPAGNVSGSRPTSASGTVRHSPGNTLAAGASNGEWIRVTAPATIGSMVFSSWTGPSNFSTTDATLCAPGFGDNGTNDYTANYVQAPAAPVKTTTSINAVSGAGTFGGSATYTATLSAGSTGVGGKTVAFSVGDTTIGSATTNASGVTSLTADLGGRNAGSHPVTATFTEDGTHLGSTGNGTLTVAKAPSSTVVSCPADTTYDGSAQTPCTAKATGAGGLDQTVPVTHTDNVNAGTATAAASFAATTNHLASTDSTTFTIDKAATTTTVTCPSSRPYTGSPLTPCSAEVTGVAGFKQPVEVVYSANTNAGTATATADFAGTTNHRSSRGTAQFAIDRVAQSTLTITTPDRGTFGDTLELGATGGSGTGAIGFAVSSGSDACRIGTGANAGKLEITRGTGTCEVVATRAGDDNHEASTATKTVAVAKATTELTLSGLSRVYNGSTFAATVTTSVGDLTGISVSYSRDGESASPRNAGSYRVQASLDHPDYRAETVVDTLVVTPKPLSGSFVVADKVYDGSRDATVSDPALDGVVEGDEVRLELRSAAFTTSSAGTGVVVTAEATLAGKHAANYTVPAVATAKADITPKTLTGSFTAADKVYDRTTTATVSGRTLTGVIDGDQVTLDLANAGFASKDVADDIDVTATASLTGDHAANYTLAPVAAAKADITPKTLTGSFTAADKVYDRTTTATVSGRTLTGVIDGDQVTLDLANAGFASKDVADDIDVTASASLTGDHAANYTLAPVAAAKANITPKTLTGSFTAANKVYDGTTTAVAMAKTLDGALGDDVVTLVLRDVTFASKNAATGIKVTAGKASIEGADARNYTLASVGNTSANIGHRVVEVVATAEDKVYDGTTAAEVTLSVEDVLEGETVSAKGDAQFADRHVGTDKTVTVSGISLVGDDASNYAPKLTEVTATASITTMAVTGSFTVADKVYDGTTAADVRSVELTGVKKGDEVSLQLQGATFDTKDAGRGKTVTAVDPALHGPDAGNYALTVADTTADITPKGITGTFAAANKTYDGTTTAEVKATSLVGTVDGDKVQLTGGTATFDDKNVGTAKTVTLTGAKLEGEDAANYTWNGVSTTTADITARSLTVTANATSRTYDGTTAASVSLSTDKLSGDVVTAAHAAAAFDDKLVGTGKTVTVTGITIAGADARNYTLSNTTATSSADITKRSVTGSFAAANKVFDGTTAASASDRSLADVVVGDAVRLTGGTATFDTAAVGSGKTVTLNGASLSGTDAGNYTLVVPVTAKASITAWNAQGHGFHQPVGAANSVFVAAPATAPAATASTVWNSAKGGSTIPLKFNVLAGGVEQTTTAAVTGFTATKLTCNTGATSDEVDFVTTGSTTLRYDAADKQFIQNWQTPKVTADGCYRATVTFADGSSLSAFFRLRK
ncbi:YDG domain-containing protein [Egicoccus halophilus]|uniref:YDG domain-containing protein n=1 Tax=Egicoccus halophilus TaxID=1670830 RepID=UPI001030A344|nr:YDG domain-containing protein [Egicoccus halophilus]